MRYYWNSGIDRREENVQRGLLVGLPVIFAALVLGPLKMTPHTSHPTAPQTKVAVSRKPAANGSSSTGGAPAGNGTSQNTNNQPAPSQTSQTGSGPVATGTPTSQTASVGYGGGSAGSTTVPTPSGGTSGTSSGSSPSSSPTTSTSSGLLPASTTLPGTSLTVDQKPVASTSGLTLTLN